MASALSKQDIARLSFVFNSVYNKLFNIKDITVIHNCQFFTGFLNFELQYDFDRFVFLRNLIYRDLLNPVYDYDRDDHNDFLLLQEKYKIDTEASMSKIRKCFWDYFAKIIEF